MAPIIRIFCVNVSIVRHTATVYREFLQNYTPRNLFEELIGTVVKLLFISVMHKQTTCIRNERFYHGAGVTQTCAAQKNSNCSSPFEVSTVLVHPCIVLTQKTMKQTVQGSFSRLLELPSMHVHSRLQDRYSYLFIRQVFIRSVEFSLFAWHIGLSCPIGKCLIVI